jgi:hypothetical protein
MSLSQLQPMGESVRAVVRIASAFNLNESFALFNFPLFIYLFIYFSNVNIVQANGKACTIEETWN